MAKTTAVRTLKIVDLIRKRNQFKYIDVPQFPVEVKIEVTTSSMAGTPKPAPSSVLDRLENEARGKLEEYEKIITDELTRIEAKIGKLMEEPGPDAKKEAGQMVGLATGSVKNALAAAQSAADVVVENRLKKEAQGDQLLTEARVGTAWKVGTGIISLSTSVAKLVATAGADVTSYVSIAKTLFDFGRELNQQLKGEEALRKDLKAGVDAFLNLRGNVVMQALKRQNLTDTSRIPSNPADAAVFIAKGVVAAGNELSKGRNEKQIAKEVLDFVVKGIKSQYDSAESARVAYRNHTAKMRQKVDATSSKADELEAAMKASKTLRDGVAVGAKCMALKGSVRKMAGGLDTAEKFLSDMQAIMKGGGLECDDATVLQKLKQFDVSTMLSSGKEVASAASDIYDLVKSLA